MQRAGIEPATGHDTRLGLPVALACEAFAGRLYTSAVYWLRVTVHAAAANRLGAFLRRGGEGR